MEIDDPLLVEKIKHGEVGIFPTDTAFGIGCRMDKPDSVSRIFDLRNRPREKAMLILVASIEMAREYVDIPNDTKEKLLEKFWPGGLTVILKCNTNKVPEVVRAAGDTLAVRLPDHKQLVELIKKVGFPLIAPSANYAGDTTPVRLSEVDSTLLSKVDFVINGVCTMEGVSTIVDVTDGQYKILRQGVVKL